MVPYGVRFGFIIIAAWRRVNNTWSSSTTYEYLMEVGNRGQSDALSRRKSIAKKPEISGRWKADPVTAYLIRTLGIPAKSLVNFAL